jgi:hypothetical protein
MSAISGVQLSLWQTVFWAVLLVAAVAATVLSLRKKQEQDQDAFFWNAFAGLVVIIPALLVPALLSPAVGLVLLCLGAATAFAALFGERRVGELRRQQSLHAATAARHRDILRRWQLYELDPGRQIDYPAMSDARVPSTAELFRAMRQAESSRLMADGGYPAAVEQLAKALEDAESAAGAAPSPGVTLLHASKPSE